MRGSRKRVCLAQPQHPEECVPVEAWGHFNCVLPSHQQEEDTPVEAWGHVWRLLDVPGLPCWRRVLGVGGGLHRFSLLCVCVDIREAVEQLHCEGMTQL